MQTSRAHTHTHAATAVRSASQNRAQRDREIFDFIDIVLLSDWWIRRYTLTPDWRSCNNRWILFFILLSRDGETEKKKIAKRNRNGTIRCSVALIVSCFVWRICLTDEMANRTALVMPHECGASGMNDEWIYLAEHVYNAMSHEIWIKT